MTRRTFLRGFAGTVALALLGDWSHINTALAERPYKRLVILGDPHLPVRPFHNRTSEKRAQLQHAKESVIRDINAWDDVDAVVAVGDIVARQAIPKEYNYCTKYFAELHHPHFLINGNHDYLYKSSGERLVKADRATRQKKLNTFREKFHLPSLYYSRNIGGYHLIFLAADGKRNLLADISDEQMHWFRKDLSSHAKEPTIVFFHAPLKGTLLPYNTSVNTPGFIAQPALELEYLLKSNPQVRFWVSGHTHTPETQPSFADPEVNLYLGQVMNIHNATMDRLKITTNSMYLYPDHVEIRTYNHKTHQWIKKLDRSFSL